MRTDGNRGYISKHHRILIEKMTQDDILGFKNIANKDRFLIAVALGMNRPMDLKNKDGYFQESTLQTYDKAMFSSLVLWKSKNDDEIDENAKLDTAIKFSEGYAEAGFQELEELCNNTKENITKKIFVELDLIYQKNVISLD